MTWNDYNLIEEARAARRERGRRKAEQWLAKRKRCIRLLEMLAAIIAIAAIVALRPAKAAETEGMFEDTPSLIEQYRQPNLRDGAGQLMDGSAYSCCGRADAYWADEFERNGEGQLVAVITDPRADNLFRGNDKEGTERVHVPIGTRIVIPDAKVITFADQPKNTTHHGWVWVSVYVDEVDGHITAMNVICYLYPEAG